MTCVFWNTYIRFVASQTWIICVIESTAIECSLNFFNQFNIDNILPTLKMTIKFICYMQINYLQIIYLQHHSKVKFTCSASCSCCLVLTARQAQAMLNWMRNKRNKISMYYKAWLRKNAFSFATRVFPFILLYLTEKHEV